MRVRTAGILLAALFAAVPAFAARLQLDMKRAVQVNKSEIRLDEVATLSAETPALAAVFGRVKLGDAPYPGNARTLSRAYVEMVLRRHDLAPEDIAWKGSESCIVTVASKRVSGREIALAAERFLRELPLLADKNVSFEVVTTPRDQTVSATRDPELVVIAPAMTQAWGRAKVYVKIMDGKRQLAVVPVTLHITCEVKMVYASRPIRRGVRIGEGDIQVKEATLGPGSGDVPYLTDAALALGKTAVHAVPAGTPLTVAMVTEPLAVRRGDDVSIYLRSPSLEVVTKGIAQADGRTGETIGATIAGTGKTVSGRLTGPGALELAL